MKRVWEVRVRFAGRHEDTKYWVEATKPETALRLGRKLARRNHEVESGTRGAARIVHLAEEGSIDARA